MTFAHLIPSCSDCKRTYRCICKHICQLCAHLLVNRSRQAPHAKYINCSAKNKNKQLLHLTAKRSHTRTFICMRTPFWGKCLMRHNLQRHQWCYSENVAKMPAFTGFNLWFRAVTPLSHVFPPVWGACGHQLLLKKRLFKRCNTGYLANWHNH